MTNDKNTIAARMQEIATIPGRDYDIERLDLLIRFNRILDGEKVEFYENY